MTSHRPAQEEVHQVEAVAGGVTKTLGSGALTSTQRSWSGAGWLRKAGCHCGQEDNLGTGSRGGFLLRLAFPPSGENLVTWLPRLWLWEKKPHDESHSHLMGLDMVGKSHLVS